VPRGCGKKLGLLIPSLENGRSGQVNLQRLQRIVEESRRF
jgi:hypothetical protein